MARATYADSRRWALCIRTLSHIVSMHAAACRSVWALVVHCLDATFLDQLRAWPRCMPAPCGCGSAQQTHFDDPFFSCAGASPKSCDRPCKHIVQTSAAKVEISLVEPVCAPMLGTCTGWSLVRECAPTHWHPCAESHTCVDLYTERPHSQAYDAKPRRTQCMLAPASIPQPLRAFLDTSQCSRFRWAQWKIRSSSRGYR